MGDNKTNKTEIEDIIRNTRKTLLFRQLIPMEAVSGWPIPFVKNGRVYIKIPYYSTENDKNKGTVLYPPLASITIDYKSQVIIEYINTRHNNSLPELSWEKAVGIFPHEAIAKLSVGDYKNLRKVLMTTYDTIIDCLVSGSTLSSELDNKFSELLSLLMEPGLKPYYMSIAPKFFGHFLKHD